MAGLLPVIASFLRAGGPLINNDMHSSIVFVVMPNDSAEMEGAGETLIQMKRDRNL